MIIFNFNYAPPLHSHSSNLSLYYPSSSSFLEFIAYLEFNSFLDFSSFLYSTALLDFGSFLNFTVFLNFIVSLDLELDWRLISYLTNNLHRLSLLFMSQIGHLPVHAITPI